MPVFDEYDAVYLGDTRLDRAYLGGTQTSFPLRKRGAFQSYAKSPYSSWTGMWGVYLPQNDDLEFTCDVQVFPAVFPDRTKFTWDIDSDPDWPGINGYLHVDYGNYDDSPGTITPREVYTITDLVLDVEWTFDGDEATGLLCECWLTGSSHATGALDKLFEVGFLPKCSASSAAFAASLPAVGTGSFVDDNGVTWNVGESTDGSGLLPYYVATRVGYVDHQGALDFKGYFAFLQASGEITGNEWFNGVAFGPEPVSGLGSTTVDSYTPTYGGTARVPWTISSLVATTQSSTQINLTWTQAAGATSHQYRVNGGSWTTTSGPNSQSVTGLSASTLYTFEVRGVNSTGNGTQSNTASATTGVPAASNIISNGTFASATGWDGLGSNGKSVSGGKAHFVASNSFDGISQTGRTIVVGKYYELTWTISGVVGTCDATPFLWSTTGGANSNGNFRAVNGTYTERLIGKTGQNAFGFHISSGGTGTLDVDDITLVGPYNTATVGGS